MTELKDLKVGDEVYYTTDYTKEIKTIDKVTPTGLIKIGSTTFYDNGHERTSDPWNFSRIEILTDEIRKTVQLNHKRIRLRNLIKTVDAFKLSVKQCDKLTEVIKNISN